MRLMPPPMLLMTPLIGLMKLPLLLVPLPLVLVLMLHDKRICMLHHPREKPQGVALNANTKYANITKNPKAKNRANALASDDLNFTTIIYYIIIYPYIIYYITHCPHSTMHQTHALYIVLAIVVTGVGLHLCYQNKNRNGWRREGFALSPGSFPDASAHPLLHNDYPLITNDNVGVSNLSSTDLGSYYPVFDASYAQYTNNVRYWQTPNNGKCTPPEFCGTMYANKPIKDLHIVPVPKPISLNAEVRRVNFYGSDAMACPDVPAPDVANCLYYGRKTNSLTPPPRINAIGH